MHALGIIAETAGVKMGELGTTTFRPPYTPLTFGTIVGRNVGTFFDITRKTPIHDWHVKIKLNLKMSDNGKELGTIQKTMKICMKLFKEKVKLLETALVY